MAAKIELGAIIEIPVKGGFAYAQYVHKHENSPRFGAMILVFPEIHKEPLSDFSKLSEQQKHYFTFFPLGAAVSRKIFKVIANQPIPEYAKNFPLFKTGMTNKEGKIEVWWLWDGEKERKVGTLTNDQKKLSVRSIWNDTLLIERIENGWSLENVELL